MLPRLNHKTTLLHWIAALHEQSGVTSKVRPTMRMNRTECKVDVMVVAWREVELVMIASGSAFTSFGNVVDWNATLTVESPWGKFETNTKWQRSRMPLICICSWLILVVQCGFVCGVRQYNRQWGGTLACGGGGGGGVWLFLNIAVKDTFSCSCTAFTCNRTYIQSFWYNSVFFFASTYLAKSSIIRAPHISDLTPYL